MAALQELGYANVYHMREVGKNYHQDSWISLLDAKYGSQRRQIERGELEKILEHFSVSTL